MVEQLFRGTPASPGVGLGKAWRPHEKAHATGAVPPRRRERERDRAVSALARTAEALSRLASGLAPAEAEVVETGALMAGDPVLTAAVERAILDEGLTAAEAILRATGEHAAVIAALGDDTLAARADDVRSLGRRAARLTNGATPDAPPDTGVIMIARDLGPADVAELAPALAGVALVGGATTAHASIVARSLGVPMVTGLEARLLEVADGTPLVLDGSSGSLTVEPSVEQARAAEDHMGARRLAAQRAHELRDQPAITTDGARIGVLANVASPEELRVGLQAGAEGIGLLRTELAFLDAVDWPTEEQHTDRLEPILAGLGDRPAVVRVLDFGVDKSPPFLSGISQRGLELLLANRAAFICQLRAILLCARDRDVRVLLPMVDTTSQVELSRAIIEQVARSLGVERVPPLGAMIETPVAADNAEAIAQQSDFLSIGTNDLTAATLGADRFAQDGGRAYDPRVLRVIARSVAAAHGAGIPIEVCGEAASDPIMLPLLIGLGVDELSVGAARVGEVRSWICALEAAEAAGLARSALTMDSAEEVQSAPRLLAAASSGIAGPV